jgi:ATP adenylyltransferase
MERLWSPWRLAYVTGQTGDKARCVFCDAADPAPDASGQDSLVLVRGRVAYVILNLYPYNNGHLMVVPYKHTDTLTGLDADELHELADLTRLS